MIQRLLAIIAGMVVAGALPAQSILFFSATQSGAPGVPSDITPVAAFSATPLTGDATLLVQFSDLSSGGPTSWAWDIDNDGDTDYTSQHPSHSYTVAGVYSVKLTVSDAVGSSTLTKNAYINVGDGGGVPTPGLEYHVSPDGDNSDGLTFDTAFHTVQQAQAQIAADRGIPWEGALVHIWAGRYYFTSTWQLDDDDSGTEAFPVVYRFEEPNETVFTGAFLVDDADWTQVTSADTFAWSRLPVSVRSDVYRIDVDTLTGGPVSKGDTPNDEDDQEDILRLIDDGQMRTLARYPDGAMHLDTAWIRATSVANSPSKMITLPDPVPATWNENGQQIYCQGLFRQSWNMDYRNVSAITGTSSSTITVNYGSTLGTGGMGQNPVVNLRNAMESLNVRGEYVFLQNSSDNTLDGVLYYYPPATGAPEDVSLSLLDVLIDLGDDDNAVDAAEWITFDGVVAEGTRSMLVRCDGGDGIRWSNCKLRNFSGHNGVGVLTDMTNSTITNSTMLYGALGVLIFHGGNADTLTEGNNSMLNNEIGHFGLELHASISAGIKLDQGNEGTHTDDGCGFLFEGNYMHDFSDSGIAAYCAEVDYVFNTFERGQSNTGDSGVITAAFSLTNIHARIANNLFKDCRRLSLLPIAEGANYAVYSDVQSHWTIEDNHFVNCEHASIQGVGKDHIIRRNRADNCHTGHYRGPWVMANRHGKETELTQTQTSDDLDDTPLTSPPWSTAGGFIDDLFKYRDGQIWRPGLLYFERMTFVDNLATTGLPGNMGEFRGSTVAPISVPPLSVGIDATQLNYPVGAVGEVMVEIGHLHVPTLMPEAGGGTVTASSQFHVPGGAP